MKILLAILLLASASLVALFLTPLVVRLYFKWEDWLDEKLGD